MQETKYFTSDRRYAKRYDMPLKLTYIDPETNRPRACIARNISSRGLRFPVHTKLSKGTILDLKIEDPFSSSFISTDGEVVWLGDFVAGEEPEDVRYEIGVRLSKKRIY